MFWQAKTGRRSRNRQKVLPKRRSIAVLPAVGKQVSDLHPRDGCCDICFPPPKKICDPRRCWAGDAGHRSSSVKRPAGGRRLNWIRLKARRQTDGVFVIQFALMASSQGTAVGAGVVSPRFSTGMVAPSLIIHLLLSRSSSAINTWMYFSPRLPFCSSSWRIICNAAA